MVSLRPDRSLCGLADFSQDIDQETRSKSVAHRVTEFMLDSCHARR
jgi:hypothetical protein